jgi:undecaprenyl-diphosphatase
MLAISFLGSFSGLLLIIIASLFALKNKKLTFFMGINLLATHLFNRILKFVYDRPRPDFILIKETGSSLPSGHAMCSMAFYGLLIYLTSKYVKEKKKRNILNSFLVIIILLIGFSRIYLNVHYLTDIMFGYAFGLLSLLLFINIIKFKEVEL